MMHQRAIQLQIIRTQQNEMAQNNCISRMNMNHFRRELGK
jgi:hypothetical protein